jgi:hypothetical protein
LALGGEVIKAFKWLQHHQELQQHSNKTKESKSEKAGKTQPKKS